LAAEGRRYVLSGGAQTTYPMDGGGRITFPAKYNRVLSGDLVVVASPEEEFPSVWIYEREVYLTWVESIIRIKAPRVDGRRLNYLRTRLFGQAEELQVDKASRILIPKDLRHLASLSTTVKIIGADDHLEIWNEEIYAQYLAHCSGRLHILKDDLDDDFYEGTVDDFSYEYIDGTKDE